MCCFLCFLFSLLWQFPWLSSPAPSHFHVLDIVEGQRRGGAQNGPNSTWGKTGHLYAHTASVRQRKFSFVSAPRVSPAACSSSWADCLQKQPVLAEQLTTALSNGTAGSYFGSVVAARD